MLQLVSRVAAVTWVDELYCISKMVIGRPQYFHHNTIADKQQWTEYNILYGFGSGWYLSSFLSLNNTKSSRMLLLLLWSSLWTSDNNYSNGQWQQMFPLCRMVWSLGTGNNDANYIIPEYCVGGPGEMKLGQLSC